MLKNVACGGPLLKTTFLWAAGKAQDSGCKKKKVKLYWNKIEETNEKN